MFKSILAFIGKLAIAVKQWWTNLCVVEVTESNPGTQKCESKDKSTSIKLSVNETKIVGRRLTDNTVKRILADYERGTPIPTLSTMYSVPIVSITNILQGKTYRHVTNIKSSLF